ncbi:MAG: hypothetical protein KC933_40740, partial [Myxococcales bacterium]|nr:hypothetical protein [Myxococcales bacterium]
MSAAAVLAAIVARLATDPPSGLSVDDIQGFAERNRAALLGAIEGALKERSPRPTTSPPGPEAGEPTPWGGRRGAELDGSQVERGQRVVTAEGEHGAIVRNLRMTWDSAHGGRTTYRYTIQLDSGRTEDMVRSSVFEELA